MDIKRRFRHFITAGAGWNGQGKKQGVATCQNRSHTPWIEMSFDASFERRSWNHLHGY
jgi:hypothetical protein